MKKRVKLILFLLIAPWLVVVQAQAAMCPLIAVKTLKPVILSHENDDVTLMLKGIIDAKDLTELNYAFHLRIIYARDGFSTKTIHTSLIGKQWVSIPQNKLSKDTWFEISLDLNQICGNHQIKSQPIVIYTDPKNLICIEDGKNCDDAT